MKKLFILLSLLIVPNLVVHSTATADYSQHVKPTLKVVGGLLAAGAAIGTAALCKATLGLEIDADLMNRAAQNPQVFYLCQKIAAGLLATASLGSAVLSAKTFTSVAQDLNLGK